MIRPDQTPEGYVDHSPVKPKHLRALSYVALFATIFAAEAIRHMGNSFIALAATVIVGSIVANVLWVLSAEALQPTLALKPDAEESAQQACRRYQNGQIIGLAILVAMFVGSHMLGWGIPLEWTLLATAPFYVMQAFRLTFTSGPRSTQWLLHEGRLEFWLRLNENYGAKIKEIKLKDIDHITQEPTQIKILKGDNVWATIPADRFADKSELDRFYAQIAAAHGQKSLIQQ